MSITGKILHYVLKTSNRNASSHFYINILGMKVLRHEEFSEGCEAACNGPYASRWSKTMVGYGPESSHFVIELVYNYGISSYALGNNYLGIVIQSKEIVERAKKHEYPMEEHHGAYLIEAPDGYKFYIINEPQPKDKDPVQKITLASSSLEHTINYWVKLLHMKIVNQKPNSIELSYGDNQAILEFRDVKATVNHGEADGRIAFATPKALLSVIQEKMEAAQCTILTPMLTLDTPGKATVTVVILGDPDNHQICFVDEESFSLLSEVDPKAGAELDKYIKSDKSLNMHQAKSDDSCSSTL